MGNETQSEWYETLFDDRYLEFYEELLNDQVADDDAAFIDRALALRPASRVLDLGCGFGRHSVRLAALGHQVTGVDLSERMLSHARRIADSRGVSVRWEQRDMRELEGLGPFDACVCIYTVLGYFDDEGNEAVLRAAHRALESGGPLLLDLSNPLAMMRGWPGTSWRERESGITCERSSYDALTGRLSTERRVFRFDGSQVELPTSVVRMYAPSETARMLKDCGFGIEQLHGGFRDQAFDWRRSLKQVWVARRSENARNDDEPGQVGD